jgi:hypothetical protein
VLACSVIIIGGFILYRRTKRGTLNAGVSGSSQHDEEDIAPVTPKDSGLRYPNTEGQDYSANLANDKPETSRSPFEPKFTPAIISISS